jgi:site-specific DNA-methyltransferase (adenine-specific)
VIAPYFETDLGKLYHGDCLEIIPNLPEIDMLITSPPYNVGKNYGNNINDNKPYEIYLNWLSDVWKEFFKKCVDGGRICINVNDQGRNPYYPIHADIASGLRHTWYMMGIIVWDKQNCLSNTAWGSWMSPSAPSLRGMHEYIIIAGKNGKKKQSNRCKDVWEKKEFLESTLEIWRFSPETKRKKHPSPYPTILPYRLCKLFSYINDIVLDPFFGSGTTAIACEKLNRRWIGIEISEEYCEISAKRIEA